MREYLNARPRRNRSSAGVRALVSESQVRTDKLIEPLFLIDGTNRSEDIRSMPGISRLSDRSGSALRALFFFPLSMIH
mgnify:CR=1 FL=1